MTFVRLNFSQAEKKGGVTYRRQQTKIDAGLVVVVQVVPVEADNEQEAEYCQRYGGKKPGTAFFAEKEYSGRGKKKDLEVAKKRRQSRADVHDTFMPEKKVESEDEAAKSNQQQLEGSEFFEIFTPDSGAQQENCAKKNPIKSRRRWRNICQFDKNP